MDKDMDNLDLYLACSTNWQRIIIIIIIIIIVIIIIIIVIR